MNVKTYQTCSQTKRCNLRTPERHLKVLRTPTFVPCELFTIKYYLSITCKNLDVDVFYMYVFNSCHYLHVKPLKDHV